MVDSFAFSEVVRKLANLIRIGKISEINGNQVKVRIGRATTGWLPVVSQAGDTSVWTPISKDEQVTVFSPYGESAQGFVLRSINYDNFQTPENTEEVNFSTDSDVRIDGSGECSASFDYGFDLQACTMEFSSASNILISSSANGIKLRTPKAVIELGDNSIMLKCGNSEITLSDSGIIFSCGSSTINLSDSNISLNSGSISTTPPVCKCSGGL